ncbi:MAG TPA: leucyl/phenylalanyl-tRNA--protein transferase [Candidatus Hydrogenedentes bacterium]|nr:leucyl/phenylalanyl-tRNA--protein transferase [Candidatus Hydrogenedentota bacterium]
MPVFRLTSEMRFPPPHMADPEGILAIGGDLSVPRLLLAYRLGIFPWYSEGDPILWWSPDPRMLLFPEEFIVSRSLRRVIRSRRYEVRMDTAFDRVIEACATARGPGRESTWITPEMMAAYRHMHQAGYAHSIETWEAGRLVGGLYGISLGSCFFGESMFHHAADASKVALAALVETVTSWRFSFIDCQVANAHLASLGAREVPRTTFLKLLAQGVQHPTRTGPWTALQGV